MVGGTRVTRADYATWVAQTRSSGDALSALANRVALAEAAKKEGIDSSPDVKARVAAAEREILAQAYLDHRSEDATSEASLRKRYEAERSTLARKRVHVAQILIRVADDAGRDAALARATQAYARAVSGEDFAALARELSEDKVSAASGGDLGPILENQVDPVFFAEAAKVAKGSVSPPFRTTFGVHVLKANEDSRSEMPSFDDVRARLAAEARREAEAQATIELRERLGIKLFSEHVEGGKSK